MLTLSKVSAIPSSLVLENDRLCVEVAPPGSYTKARFCWGAFISQVRLKAGNRVYTFCTSENEGETGPFSGGAGLCNEFDLFHPVGYEDAYVGHWFPKLGVGLVRRKDEDDYFFHRDYEMAPFSLQVERRPGQLCFVNLPWPARGYAARLEQRLSLEENRLRIDYRLDNVGTKALATREYRHNFLAIDQRGPSSGLVLRLPFSHEMLNDDESLQVKRMDVGGEWHWNGASETLVRKLALPPKGRSKTGWELEWIPDGVGVREEVSDPLAAFHLYTTPRLVSPEAFVDISVDPGGVQTWSRVYTFFARDAD
ncbi:MAG: hypothetical protein WDO13_07925 [Verrucomicrobiota bacterium]